MVVKNTIFIYFRICFSRFDYFWFRGLDNLSWIIIIKPPYAILWINLEFRQTEYIHGIQYLYNLNQVR